MLYMKQYTKFMMLSYALALVLLCLTAVVFTYTNINDKYLDTFVFVIVGVTNLIGSMLIAKKIKERGIVLGMIFGIIYFLLIYFLYHEVPQLHCGIIRYVIDFKILPGTYESWI